MIDNMLSFLKTGGFFMYPIGMIGVIAAAIVIERLISNRINRKNIQLGFDVFETVSIADKDSAIKDVIAQESILSEMMEDAFDAYTERKVSKESFDELIYIGSLNAMRRLRARVEIISTLANVATLLGLLGTIMGLIGSFEAVAHAGGDKSAVLSSSVSVAMNTTAFGLIVAIPLLLLYVLIDNQSSKTLDNLYIASSKIAVKLYN